MLWHNFKIDVIFKNLASPYSNIIDPLILKNLWKVEKKSIGNGALLKSILFSKTTATTTPLLTITCLPN